MITYLNSSLFTSPAHVLVNTVNIVGVMGKGIAKDFKDIFPEMFKVYQERCENGELTIGGLLLYRTPNKWVLNFPTKKHWRHRSRIEYIEAGLKTFVENYEERSLTSVAFPQLGCGNGGLDWESEVRPVMERYLADLPIDIYIHVRVSGTAVPEHLDRERMVQWLRMEPRSLGFSEVWDDLVQELARIDDRHPVIQGWGVATRTFADEIALVFARDGEEIVLPKEDLLTIWQSLRGFGLMAKRDLPIDIQPATIPLFSLLTRLGYVQDALFAPLSKGDQGNEQTTDSMLKRSDAHGIRLVPASFPTEVVVQPSLLPVANVA